MCQNKVGPERKLDKNKSWAKHNKETAAVTTSMVASITVVRKAAKRGILALWFDPTLFVSLCNNIRFHYITCLLELLYIFMSNYYSCCDILYYVCLNI